MKGFILLAHIYFLLPPAQPFRSFSAASSRHHHISKNERKFAAGFSCNIPFPSVPTTPPTAPSTHYPPAPATIPFHQLTQNQKKYWNHLSTPNNTFVFGIGPAGTGKTMLACQYAIEQLKKEKIEKIVITRPVISVAEEEIGYLPGTLQSKMQPWIQPILDVFADTYTRKQIASLIETGKIEIAPFMFMRGRTFKNTILIADEVQNTTPKQMFMLLTRCGVNCRMFLTGDLHQSDLPVKNGLHDFIERHNASVAASASTSASPSTSQPFPIKLISFTNEDIQRSPIVALVSQMYHDPPTEPATP